jgi:hypothetical protein
MNNQRLDESGQAGGAGIVEQIESQINRRLGGQVNDLRVIVQGEGLVLQGRSLPRQAACPAGGHGDHRTADPGQRDSSLIRLTGCTVGVRCRILWPELSSGKRAIEPS